MCQKYMRIANKWTVVERELLNNPLLSIDEADRLLRDPDKKKEIQRNLFEQAKHDLLKASQKRWTGCDDEKERVEKQNELNREYNAGLFKVRRVSCSKVYHDFDSGAFTLGGKKVKEWLADHPGDDWGYYDSEEFFEYMDAYAAFVKKHHEAFDRYVSVDAIGSQELSHRNLRYLETRHGLKPIPVVHFPSDPKCWLNLYLDEGHDLIGMGSSIPTGNGDEIDKWEKGFWEIANVRQPTAFEIPKFTQSLVQR